MLTRESDDLGNGAGPAEVGGERCVPRNVGPSQADWISWRVRDRQPYYQSKAGVALLQDRTYVVCSAVCEVPILRKGH